NASAGRKIVEREFKRLAIDHEELSLDKITKQLNFKHLEDMYAALGAGDIRLSQVVGAAQRQVDKQANETEQLPLSLPEGAKEKKADTSDLRIRGVGNLLTSLASCCKPAPGDAVTGYITVGRGVSVHRADCPNIIQLREQDHQRLIEVEWGLEPESTYPVDILIEAYDRAGLLRDVMIKLADGEVNVTAANTLTDKASNVARLSITIEIPSLEFLGRIMDKINQIPNVIDVHRQRSGSAV
ncbi:MAG: ACT domain-containing protein, partial [Pontibacterium sp.]